MSRKIFVLSSVFGLFISQHAAAGGNVTLVVSWRPLSNVSVPTLSEYALIMLALLVGALLFRALQSNKSIARSVLALVGAGTLGATLLTVEEADSGMARLVPADQCTGSVDVVSDYSGELSSGQVRSPAALENNCGQDVVVTIGQCDDPFYDVSCNLFRESDSCLASGDILANGETGNLPYCED